jgi:hypothetical protein
LVTWAVFIELTLRWVLALTAFTDLFAVGALDVFARVICTFVCDGVTHSIEFTDATGVAPFFFACAFDTDFSGVAFDPSAWVCDTGTIQTGFVIFAGDASAGVDAFSFATESSCNTGFAITCIFFTGSSLACFRCRAGCAGIIATFWVAFSVETDLLSFAIDIYLTRLAVCTLSCEAALVGGWACHPWAWVVNALSFGADATVFAGS